jgi:hypothetical protein
MTATMAIKPFHEIHITKGIMLINHGSIITPTSITIGTINTAFHHDIININIMLNHGVQTTIVQQK